MTVSRTFRGAIAILALLSAAASLALANTGQPAGEKQPEDVLANLKLRNIGPAVSGGRVSATVGIPGDPNVYYTGGAAGGVFKTTDGGLTWKAIFEHEKTGSIGAIAVAPSNPNLVWVGTGEGNIRNDVIDGDGVYFSSDAGHSWKFMGLGDTQHISTIVVDPHDSNTVFVAALGHAWGPNAERGVFKTTDGGKTWNKVLYVNDTTGAADLAIAPGNSKVLFASMWEFRRYPWTLMDGGSDSGIYRSTDGGETWQKLTKGLPEDPFGRSAVAVAPSNPDHVYVEIAAKDGLLWESRDMGDSWSKVSDNHSYDVRPFYFSRLYVSPDDENKIFFLSFNLMESEDGGKTAFYADRGVHPDHHALWIDPKNPERIIQGNDGGVFLSTDGAKSWQFLDGMPLAQFYQVATNGREPYTVCGGLQDNDSWCGVSSDLGRHAVTGAAWYSVVGGDGEYAVPSPSDPDIVYTDSQNAFIIRLDLKTHLEQFIRPYMDSVEEVKPSELKYRFNWTSPIAVSPTDANEVYIGGDIVFKSADAGKTWSPISGDLTRNDKSKQQVAGGPIQHDISGAETYDTILAITLAPTDHNVIWVGTDDGLVQVTRDAGKNWTNVASNISGAPEWARVYQIGVSPFDAGTAYVTYDAHELDNRHVYIYRTEDYGASWTKITDGLPDGAVAHVVREDPNQRGFLVAGTDVGLSYSSDRGGHWEPLKANFPTTPVFDITFVKDRRDLVVATHGRGIFVLDDIRPIEELTSDIQSGAFHLFNPAPGMLLHHWETDEGQGEGYTAPNAPQGVVVDYFLKSEIKPTDQQKQQHESPVKIVVTDEHGATVATDYGPSEAGVNRFVWNMRYQGPEKLRFEKPMEANEFFNPDQGPLVVPGTYHIAVTVSGQSQTKDARVEPDPNLHIDPAVFRAQTEAGLEARNQVSALNEMLNRIEAIDKTVVDFSSMVETSDDKEVKTKYQPIVDRGKELTKKLDAIKDAVYDPKIQHDVEEDDIHGLQLLHEQAAGMAFEVSGEYGQPPSELILAKMKEISGEIAEKLKAFNELLKTDVAEYNKAAESAGAPTVFAGSGIEVKSARGM